MLPFCHKICKWVWKTQAATKTHRWVHFAPNILGSMTLNLLAGKKLQVTNFH